MYSPKRRFRLFRLLDAAPAPAPAPAFSPASLTNLSLWLDAADPAGSGSVPSNGTTLTTWTDKSGNSRNLGVGSGTTSWNMNSVRLNSSYMSVTSSVDLANFSFFIVSMSPTATFNQAVFGARPNTSPVYNSTDGFAFYMDGNTNSTRFYGTPDKYYAESITTSSPFLSVFTGASNGVLGVWLNGTSRGEVIMATRTTTAQGFAVGAEWGGSSYSNIASSAHIYEIVVYNTTLTTLQRQQIEGYLAWKWGLQTSLPTNHPYYSARP